MAISSGVYAQGVASFCSKAFNWAATDDFRAILVKSSYTPNFQTDLDLADVVAHKVTGTSAVALPAANRLVTIASGGNYVYLDGPAAITFLSVAGTETASGVIVYFHTGVDATGILICCNAFSAPITTNGSDITVTFDTLGNVRLTYLAAT